jgi:hypothetical protein
MVITPICIFWVIVLTHDTQATAPVVPPMGIGEVCQRFDAEHPLAKRSTRAALLGGCQIPPQRRPRMVALLTAPRSTPPEMDGVDIGTGFPAVAFGRLASPQNGGLPSSAGAGSTPRA